MKDVYTAPEAEIISFDTEEKLLGGEPGADPSVVPRPPRP